MAQGYDHYLSLGANRSTIAVAKLMGRDVRTIQRWAQDWNWEGRYQQHTQVYGDKDRTGREDSPGAATDSVLAPANIELDPQSILNRFPLVEGNVGAMTKHEYRSLLGSLIRDFAERFKAGDVMIRTINDFEKVVKLDLLLMGEATERHDVNNTTNIEHNIKIEQIVEQNPMARDLISAMWRDYTNPALKTAVDESMKQLETVVTSQLTTPPASHVNGDADNSSTVIVPNPHYTRLKPIMNSPKPLEEVLAGMPFDGDEF